MQWDKKAFLKLLLGCSACPQFTESISVCCSRAKEAFLPVCPRAPDTHCDVYSSFCPLRIKSEVQRFPKLTLPFIAALGSVEDVDTCRVWEQKQLMLNTAYPSFWDQSSIYMSETCAASSGGDLKGAPWAGGRDLKILGGFCSTAEFFFLPQCGAMTPCVCSLTRPCSRTPGILHRIIPKWASRWLSANLTQRFPLNWSKRVVSWSSFPDFHFFSPQGVKVRPAAWSISGAGTWRPAAALPVSPGQMEPPTFTGWATREKWTSNVPWRLLGASTTRSISQN